MFLDVPVTFITEWVFSSTVRAVNS
jgi:hypothetical protein